MPPRHTGKRERTPRIPQELPSDNSVLSERAHAVLDLARQEAVDMKHTWIGSEHVLLGLLAYGDGSGNKILKELGVKTPELQAWIMGKVTLGTVKVIDPKSLQYTERTKRVLEHAIHQAHSLGSEKKKVGTEFLLYGLALAKDGIAEQALAHFLGEIPDQPIFMKIMKLSPSDAH